MHYFVGTYTVKAKTYCHRQFYDRFRAVVAGNPACIVDGTFGDSYRRQLRAVTVAIPTCKYVHVANARGPNFFQRSVAAGANTLRQECLLTDADYLLVIESDVIPPPDVIMRLQNSIDTLEATGHTDWGILGCLYYRGWHNYEARGLQQTQHVLSGCTIYRRSLLEQCPFRYDISNLAAFPDAYMCVDAHAAGYTMWNDHEIRCEHIKQ